MARLPFQSPISSKVVAEAPTYEEAAQAAVKASWATESAAKRKSADAALGALEVAKAGKERSDRIGAAIAEGPLSPPETRAGFVPLDQYADAAPEAEVVDEGGGQADGVGGPEDPPTLTDAEIIDLKARADARRKGSQDAQVRSLLLDNPTDPERAAEAQRLAEKAGVHPAIVEADPETFRANDRATEIAKLHETAPKFRSWLDDPANFKVAHDDETLSWWEQTQKVAGEVGSGVAKLPQSFGAGIGPGSLEYLGGYAQMAADVVDEFFRSPMPLAFRGADRSNYTAAELAFIEKEGHLPETPKDPNAVLPRMAADASVVRKYGKELGEAWTPKTSGDIEAGFVSAGKSMGQLLPWLLGAAVMKNPGPAMMGAEVTTSGQSYGEGRDAGKGVFDSALYAFVQGKIERYTEMLPMHAMFGEKELGGFVTRMAKRFGKSAASDIPGEQIATALQDANTQATLHPEKTWGEYLAERPSAALQTLVASVVQSVFMTGVSEGGAAAADKLNEGARKAHDEKIAGVISQMGDTAAASKLLKRSPEKFREAVAASTKGGDLETLLIDPEGFTEFVEANKLTTGQLAQAFRMDPAEVESAIDAGQDIPVRTADYATIVGTAKKEIGIDGATIHAGLAKHVRDRVGLTPAQRQAYEKVAAEEEAARVQLDETQNVHADEADRVRASILEEVRGLGLYSEHAAFTIASERAARVLTLAENIGVSPEEAQKLFGAVRTAGDIAAGDGSLQQTRTRTPQQIDDATITRASETLGDKQFQAWKLATLQGMNNRDIAVEMGGPEADMTEAAVQQLLSTAGKRGFAVESTAPEGAGRNRSAETQTLIAMKAEGRSHAEVAATVYPDREPAKAINQVRQLTHRFKAEIEAKRGELALAQSSKSDRRGDYSPNPNGPGLTRLFESARLDTLLHEGAHEYLDVLWRLSKQETPHPFVISQLASILNWKGYSAEWDNMFDANGQITEEGRELQESFAETYGVYFREGKAPSHALRSVFATIKQWMLGIYKSLKAMGSRINFTPEIADVFDRMLATEEAIAAVSASQTRDTEAMAKALLDKGVITPKAFERTKARLAQAREQAEADLMARLMEDYTRDRTAVWRDEERRVKADVTREIDATPAQRAYAWLTGQGWKGSEAQAESIVGAIAQGARRRMLDTMGFYSAAQEAAILIPDNIWKMGWQAARSALVKGQGGITPKKSEIEYLGLDLMFSDTKLKGDELRDAVLEDIAASRLELVERFSRFDPKSAEPVQRGAAFDAAADWKKREMAVGVNDGYRRLERSIVGSGEEFAFTLLAFEPKRRVWLTWNSKDHYAAWAGDKASPELVAGPSRSFGDTADAAADLIVAENRDAIVNSLTDAQATELIETAEMAPHLKAGVRTGPGKTRLPGNEPVFEWRALLPRGEAGSDFKSHWSRFPTEDDGVLVSVRGEERIDDKGQSTLFGGEVQSDLGSFMRNFRQKKDGKMVWIKEAEFSDQNLDNLDGVPLAGDTTTWTNVAVRAMVYRAARDGFASVSFPTADTSTLIQGNASAAQHYETNVKGALEKIAKQLGGEVRKGAVQADGVNIASQVEDWQQSPEYIALLKEMLAAESEDAMREILLNQSVSEDLTAFAMRGDDLPSTFMLKAQLSALESKSISADAYVLDITPAMRAKIVNEGFALFQSVSDMARYFEADATNESLEALWMRMARDGVAPVIRLFKLPDGRVMAFDGATYTHDDARDLLGLGNLKLKHGMFQRGTKLAVTNWYAETGKDEAVTLAQFATAMSPAAPMDKLTQALEMMAQGRAPEAIWRETGWARTLDGEWVFEIQGEPQWRIEPTQAAQTQFLDELIEWPELFEAVPVLRMVSATVRIGAAQGKYTHAGRMLPGGAVVAEIDASGPKAEVMQVLRHEIQHAIQTFMGMRSIGANTDVDQYRDTPEFKRQVALFERLQKEWADAGQGSGGGVDANTPMAEIEKLIARGLYAYNRGEAQARDVERRSRWTPTMRALVMPNSRTVNDGEVQLDKTWATLDALRADDFTRFDRLPAGVGPAKASGTGAQGGSSLAQSVAGDPPGTGGGQAASEGGSGVRHLFDVVEGGGGNEARIQQLTATIAAALGGSLEANYADQAELAFRLRQRGMSDGQIGQVTGLNYSMDGWLTPREVTEEIDAAIEIVRLREPRRFPRSIGRGGLRVVGGNTLAQSVEAPLVGGTPEGKTLAQLVGPKSTYANQEILDTAKRLEAEGKSRMQIWRATAAMGQMWYRDTDGSWITETHDIGFGLASEREIGRAEELLNHPNLFAQYPELKALQTDITPAVTKEDREKEGSLGWYRKNRSVALPALRLSFLERLLGKKPKPPKPPATELRVSAKGKQTAEYTALHELQHAVDEIEGRQFDNSKSYLLRRHERRAINTEYRRLWTSQEREAIPPWVTEQEAISWWFGGRDEFAAPAKFLKSGTLDPMPMDRPQSTDRFRAEKEVKRGDNNTDPFSQISASIPGQVFLSRTEFDAQTKPKRGKTEPETYYAYQGDDLVWRVHDGSGGIAAENLRNEAAANEAAKELNANPGRRPVKGRAQGLPAPDADKMVDFSAPLRDQNPAVREKLERLLDELGIEGFGTIDRNGNEFFRTMLGQDTPLSEPLEAVGLGGEETDMIQRAKLSGASEAEMLAELKEFADEYFGEEQFSEWEPWARRLWAEMFVNKEATSGQVVFDAIVNRLAKKLTGDNYARLVDQDGTDWASGRRDTWGLIFDHLRKAGLNGAFFEPAGAQRAFTRASDPVNAELQALFGEMVALEKEKTQIVNSGSSGFPAQKVRIVAIDSQLEALQKDRNDLDAKIDALWRDGREALSRTRSDVGKSLLVFSTNGPGAPRRYDGKLYALNPEDVRAAMDQVRLEESQELPQAGDGSSNAVPPPPGLSPMRLDLGAVEDQYGPDALAALPPEVRAYSAAATDADQFLELAKVTAKALRKKRPRSLSKFLSRAHYVGKGNDRITYKGIRDEGGEIIAMIGAKGTAPGLIAGEDSKTVRAYTIHDAAMAAYEEGYTPQLLDDADFLDALRRDLDGSDPLYKADDVATVSEIDNAEQWERWFDSQGIDVNEKDQTALRAKIEEALSGEAEGAIGPNEAAPFFNFRDGAELLQALKDGPKRAEMIRNETRRRMTQAHGDPFRDGTIQREAEVYARNEVQQRQFEIELEALSKAAGQFASVNLARETAKERLKDKQVREVLNYNQWLVLEQRWGRKALEAASKGDMAKAAEYKRYQLVNFHMFKEARKLAVEIEKTRKHLIGYEAKTKQVRLHAAGADYAEQMNGLLSDYQLRKEGKKAEGRRQARGEWIKAQLAANDPYASYQDNTKTAAEQQVEAAEAIERASVLGRLAEGTEARNYQSLTAGEFLAVKDEADLIWKLATLKDKLVRDGERRSLRLAASDIADEVRTNQPNAKPPEPLESDSPGEGIKRGVLKYFAMHRTLQSLAHQFAGGKAGGVFWSYIVKPLNEAFARLSTIRKQMGGDLKTLFSAYSEKEISRFYKDRKFIPEIGRALTTQGRLAVALNLGNEKNRKRLMDSNGWTSEQINAVVAPLTERDWKFVQATWDYLDTWFAEANRVHAAVHGVPMDRVEPLQVATRFGVYRGGYFPIAFDPNVSSKTLQRKTEADAKTTTGRIDARNRPGYGQKRAEGKVTLPLRLAVFDVVTRHLDQVATSIATEEAMFDVGRLVRQPEVEVAIVEQHGRQIYNTVVNILVTTKFGLEGASGILAHLRNGATVVGLGWKVATALLQPFGVTNSIVRVGGYWMAKGYAAMGSDAITIKRRASWATERSEFMRHRRQSQSPEVSALRKSMKPTLVNLPVPGARKVRRLIDVLNENAFALMANVQFYSVDVPTFYAGYYKAQAAGMSEEEAIAQGDQAVIDAQGGGELHQTAAIQTGAGTKYAAALRLLTNFMSYQVSTYNLAVQRVRNAKTAGKVLALGFDMILLLSIPVAAKMALDAWTKGGGDDDDDPLWEKFGREQTAFLMSPFVGLSQVAGAARGDDAFGYRGPAGLSIFAETTNAGKAVAELDFDESFWRPANKMAGMFLHYPASQLDLTIRGAQQLWNGETTDASVLFFGPKQ